jgi:hypothetical protein
MQHAFVQFMGRTLAMLMASLFLVAPAAAKDSPEGGERPATSLSFFYQFGPASGQEDAFFKALKAHTAYRKEKGDPWSWQGYAVLDGPSMGDVVVVSSGHTWSDLDAYDASMLKLGLPRHFADNVMPLIRGGRTDAWTNRVFSRLSHWPEGTVADKAMVSVYSVIPGKERAFRDALKTVVQALKKGGFTEKWLIQRTESGKTGPVYSFVFPGKRWGDFDPKSPNAYDVVSKQLGEKKADELFQTFAESTRSQLDFRVRRIDWMNTGGRQ